MSNVTTSWRLAAGLVLAALPPAATATVSDRQAAAMDVAALIDAAPAGDSATLEAALPAMHDPAGTALLSARIAAERLDRAASDRALDAWAATRDMDPRHQAIALAIGADTAFAAADYAASARAVVKWQALSDAAHHAGEATEMAQLLSIAKLLASEPRQSVIGGTPGTIPTTRDAASLVRGTVSINGKDQSAVLDTGANLSVVSASAAKALGLRMLDGAASVATATSDVPTRLAIAERLTIAGVTLSNVVFLVLDDAQLSFPLPGGYRIDAIIGFPVFRALGRIRFDQKGGFAAGDAAGPIEGPADNLRMQDNDLYVLARVNGIDAALHLDTGAGHSALSSRFAAAHPEMLAGSAQGSRQIMGAGAVMRQQGTATLAPATIALGGRTATLPALAVVTTPPPDRPEERMGVLGQDVLSRFESYAIDFTTMRFAFGAPGP